MYELAIDEQGFFFPLRTCILFAARLFTTRIDAVYISEF
jgi:hypothetical protein